MFCRSLSYYSYDNNSKHLIWYLLCVSYSQCIAYIFLQGQTQEVGRWEVLCPRLHPSEPGACLLKGVHFGEGRQDLNNNHVKEIIIIYNVWMRKLRRREIK